MNIYFSCSITGGREEQALYAEIVNFLLRKGCEVPTAHLASEDVMQKELTVDATEVFLRDLSWVRACDALVAEVSTPSHGVGYEIATALFERKPVFCCYRKGRRISKMILGNCEIGMNVYAYETRPDLIQTLERFLKDLKLE